MPTIVVGVDGSEGAARALRFAIAEARLRHDRVRAVLAWEIPAGAYDGAFTAAAVDVSAFAAAAEETVRRVIESADAEDVEIEAAPIEGHPTDVLVRESDGADLLVVGSRGLGGFRRLLLGSVSQQCALHAHCPTVIVPPPAELAGGRLHIHSEARSGPREG